MIFLILSLRMGFAIKVEECTSEEKFNNDHSKKNGKKWKDWIDGSERTKLRNLETTEDTWGSYWNPKRNASKEFVVVKRAVISEDSSRFKRLMKEIDFYEEAKNIQELSSYLPKYYGCFRDDNNVYLIIEFLNYSLQKYEHKTKSYAPLLGFTKFSNLGGNQQIEFLTAIAEAVNLLHLRGIALTNINPKNIFFKETESGITPVLINFGRSQKLVQNSKDTKQDQDELLRYHSYIFRCLEKQSDKDFNLSFENLTNSDIFGFANLIYRSGMECSPSQNKEFKVRFQFFLDSFINDDMMSFRNFIQCSKGNKGIFKDLMKEMAKPLDEIKIRFPDIIKELNRIRCPKGISKLMVVDDKLPTKPMTAKKSVITEDKKKGQIYQQKNDISNEVPKVSKKDMMRKKRESKKSQYPKDSSYSVHGIVGIKRQIGTRSSRKMEEQFETGITNERPDIFDKNEGPMHLDINMEEEEEDENDEREEEDENDEREEEDEND